MNSRNDIDKTLRRGLVWLAALSLPFGLGGAAYAADGADTARGASSVGHASATILHPTALRTDALFNSDTNFADVAGLPVAPAAIVRRDCQTEQSRQRCNLIILDMP
ncbi:MAG: hypothetical protein AAFW97_13430 [Pseudomonadota bacterium]